MSSGGFEVCLANCADYSPNKIRSALVRIFDTLGGIENFVSRGERVLVKPNFIMPRSTDIPAQTHPAVIIELCGMIKDCGADCFVADSPAWSSIRNCADILGLAEPLAKMGVPVDELKRPVRTKLNGFTVGISRTAIEADKIINLPKLKAHRQITATIAVKNMFGVVAGKEKAFKHFTLGGVEEDFCGMLIAIYQKVCPVLNIIDCVVAMQGSGPLNGEPKPLGFIAAGRDAFACEAVCAKIIGLEPAQLPILRTAVKLGLFNGDNEIECLGDSPDNFISDDFVIPEQIPLKFSLPRIFKSVIKQMFYLSRNRAGKAKN